MKLKYSFFVGFLTEKLEYYTWVSFFVDSIFEFLQIIGIWQKKIFTAKKKCVFMSSNLKYYFNCNHFSQS